MSGEESTGRAADAAMVRDRARPERPRLSCALPPAERRGTEAALSKDRHPSES
jgi:hypothetical protein